MTIVEQTMRASGDFDPFEEFAGAWNVRLAQHYWPQLNHLFAKWECIDGRLLVAPYETAENSWGESKLARLLGNAAPPETYYIFGCLNLGLQLDTWIQPDVNVLHRIPDTAAHRRFVPFDHFTMPIEFVSPSSIKRAKTEKPLLLAAAGVPFYMTVELDQDNRKVRIEQWKLIGGNYKLISTAVAGEVFTMKEPFEVSFPATELLLPEW